MDLDRHRASAGLATTVSDDLARRGFRVRFPAETERQYRPWRLEQVRPVALMLGSLAIAAWLVIPFAFVGADSAAVRLPVLYGLGWGVIVPTIVAATVYARRPGRQWLIAVVGLSLFVVAVTNLAIFAMSMPDTEASGYTQTVMFYGLLALAVRLPFRTTCIYAFALTAVGEVMASLWAAGPWDRIFVGPSGTLPFVTLVMMPGMSLIIERGLRDRFTDERLIARQQQLLVESGQLIRRYAPSAVVSRLESGDTTIDRPQRRRVTVLFCDVVGFTSLADQVDPEALARIVNDYLGALSEIIERHGGTLNEFAGDGVMAIFGAPDELTPADQVLAAVAAARDLQSSLPEWSREWYEHGITEDLRARVGINTGTISVGTFGSAVRATYTGIGLQTNIAARIQAQAKPGTILLSNTSWHLVKDSVLCEPRGQVAVKGVHFPIHLYECMERPAVNTATSLG